MEERRLPQSNDISLYAPRYGMWLSRMVQAFYLASITNTRGAPLFAYFAKGGNRRCPHKWVFRTERCNQSNSARSIAAHPCKKRKDGAPSVEMVHTEIAKGGPPAQLCK